MYRIYINETVLIISEIIPPNLEDYHQIDSQQFNILTFYKDVKAGNTSGIFLILNQKPRRLFKKIKKSFKFIKAAGGLVHNEENKYLFIFRNGKWDLPKGKVDKGEKIEKTAVREVEEECGISVNEIGDRICKTWHIYEMFGQLILKRTSWYHMKAFDQTKLKPQLEEGITKAKWVAPGDFGKLKENTYPLIRDIMEIM